MSDHCPACEIGDRILEDELVSDALHAYSESFDRPFSLADCAVHLVRFALMQPGFGWIASRQVTEYVAAPKLEAHRAAKAQAPAPKATKKRKATALRLVVGEAPTV
jgi:hypothetical protein